MCLTAKTSEVTLRTLFDAFSALFRHRFRIADVSPDYSPGVGVTFQFARRTRCRLEGSFVVDFVDEVNRNLNDNPALTFASVWFNANQRPSW